MKQNMAIRAFILLFVLLVAGFVAWAWWQDGLSSAAPTDNTFTQFEVAKGEGVKSVVTHLSQEGIIRSSTAFYILIKSMGIDKSIQAGDYRLSKSMDARTVAKELTHGVVDVWLTTLEGWRIEEIATTLAKNFDIPEKEFLSYAKEGYMFPDTYQVSKDATAAAIASLFLDTFNKKITPQMHADAQKSGLTIDQVVVLASIVEREGHNDEDRPVIAGILLNRLKKDWPLQTDATIQYALGYQPQEKSWWKKILTEDDMKIKSPYNTYLHTGLPPGPISNPGISSLQAVIYPKQTEYMYYLHDTKGNVYYAKTQEDHDQNIAKHL
jgi:UPF0755 protein